MQYSGVYVLQNLKNERYYIGSTDNIDRRIWEHNEGMVTATRFLKPLELKVFIVCKTLKEARSAEYRLKKYKSRKILEKVIKSGIFPWDFRGS